MIVLNVKSVQSICGWKSHSMGSSPCTKAERRRRGASKEMSMAAKLTALSWKLVSRSEWETLLLSYQHQLTTVKWVLSAGTSMPELSVGRMLLLLIFITIGWIVVGFKVKQHSRVWLSRYKTKLFWWRWGWFTRVPPRLLWLWARGGQVGAVAVCLQSVYRYSWSSHVTPVAIARNARRGGNCWWVGIKEARLGQWTSSSSGELKLIRPPPGYSHPRKHQENVCPYCPG